MDFKVKHLWLILPIAVGGCQHSPPRPGEVRHETDRKECAEIANGSELHAGLVKMRPDGTCDVRWWPS